MHSLLYKEEKTTKMYHLQVNTGSTVQLNVLDKKDRSALRALAVATALDIKDEVKLKQCDAYKYV